MKYILKLFRVLSLAIIYFLMVGSVQSATTLHLEVIADNLSSPLFLTSPVHDTRLFIVQQGGKILIQENDTLFAESYLDISFEVWHSGERGLLGLAFHPEYAQNGYLFVNYTTLISNKTYSRISRFEVNSLNPNYVDTSSEEVLIEIEQPYTNHNGGMVAFGPDGYLYVGFGDGGSAGDPQNNSQNGGNFFGAMLRLNVDSTLPYLIPDDNPFLDSINILDEIWAIGLRNPWRYSFDRLNGDLYIGDVGQYELEEIDFQPFNSLGGENYGWRLKEGSACYNPSSNCEVGVTLTEPILDYTHSGGVSPSGCSITGGYVYRGNCLPEFDGRYFFADYCSNLIWSLTYQNGVVVDTTEYATSIPVSQVSSFGQDSDGELYIISLGGTIYKIVPEGGSSVCVSSGCCNGIRGNIDNDNSNIIDISDLIYLVVYAFGIPTGPAPYCFEEADMNADLTLDISDIIYLVVYMFGNPTGPAPLGCV